MKFSNLIPSVSYKIRKTNGHSCVGKFVKQEHQQLFFVDFELNSPLQFTEEEVESIEKFDGVTLQYPGEPG